MKKTTKILLLGGILLVFAGAIIMLTSGSILGVKKMQAFVENGDLSITIDNIERIGNFHNSIFCFFPLFFPNLNDSRHNL